MRFLTAILVTFVVSVRTVLYADNAVVQDKLGEEVPLIDKAAARNDVDGELRLVVYAIRVAENGGPGREFGIMDARADTYDKQAGWCAATVRKNHARWVRAGKEIPFIQFLGNRYCPVGAENDPDGLNAHWVRNVTHWYEKFGGSGVF